MQPAGLGANDKSDPGWVGGYNSKTGGLEERYGPRAKIYTEQQLERLKRAVSPRYVRVLGLKGYSKGEKMLNRGIFFSFSGYQNRKIFLAGDFNNWNLIPMKRNKRGVYYFILPVREVENGRRITKYEYKFLVDGVWMNDPVHKNQMDDTLGGYVSVFELEQEDVNRQATVRIIRENGPGLESLVEFAIYLPNVENLALVGNFNNWNPQHDLPVKGQDGTYRLQMRLRPGQYYYKYIADGRWLLDLHNPETRYHSIMEELCSYLNLSVN